MIPITPDIAISENEIQEEFIRASGPGGQNVNKVASAVQLRFDVSQSPSLPEDVKRRLLKHAGRRVSADGTLIIEAKRYRTQSQNRDDAMDRLVALIKKATDAPKPRVKTEPTKASQERRLEAKRQRSKIKRLRGERPEIE
ncbi:MAG: aminoacyl-tRNA hydrolase [Candidatus Marinimicrobia bacterium]|nr:aminoacyl-tRNA hydrolase [Candidatus Neomarinimicrobiota bacterium]